MTALNIRKNTVGCLRFMANKIEDIKFSTIEEKVFECRLRAAALIMPKQSSIHVRGK